MADISSAGTGESPNLNIPKGSATVNVRLINSTSLTLAAAHLLTPAIDGVDQLTAPSFSFLVEHPSGRKLLFDLGLRKDFNNLPPALLKFLKDFNWKLEVGKNVSEILEDAGVPLTDIESVIWSHHHFDHIGDMSLFPRATELVVGPGFKKHYVPGWPSNEKSVVPESSYEGRSVRELELGSTKIGPFDALDYFGDGSYYILNSPGHTFGHIAALARVTTGNDVDEDTFVLMGGDTCHFAGQFRPSEYKPLPSEISPSPLPHLHPATCPGSLFLDIHPTRNGGQPFYQMPETSTVDLPAAHRSISHLQQLDAARNVFVIIAHDGSLVDQVDFFPRSINGWKAKGWGEKSRWQFLSCFQNKQGPLAPHKTGSL